MNTPHREAAAISARMAQLELENESLRQRSTQEGVAAIVKIIGVTSELFGGEVTLVEDCDPEFPDDRYAVVVAQTQLDPCEVPKTEREWVKRVEAIAPKCDGLRLSIRFR